MALSGDVKALIQANNGNVLAGTNNSARIYRSTDNGQSWTQITALGSGSDSVNAFVTLRNSAVVLAAVTGTGTAQGVWRSTDYGETWSKVFSHPSGAGNGYFDITAIQGSSVLVAVGPAVSNPFTPIIYSNNQGVSWTYIPGNYASTSHLAVSAYPEGNLFSLYPNETAMTGGIFAFFGTDTYYTVQGGVGGNGATTLFSTVGGGAGNGGLDMVSFLHKSPNGQYWRKALWAVKSAANTADTEIWQWPATNNGPFSFAKISTVVGENLRGLYADPYMTGQTSEHLLRAIWAGGNGKIYFSGNSGYSWVVTTEAPSGQIYSFVRTVSGVLIAGGASGEIWLSTGTPSTDPPTEPPTDPPVSVVTTRVLGMEATCDDEVYSSNKFSLSNVTHIFHYNGSAYSNLQFGTEPPYEILGSAAAVNKAAYFGSNSNDTNVPGGPFTSLVFDISQGAANITVVWEYWNGSTWATLTTQDNTDQFRNEGVNSVSWTLPTSWTAVAVNSVTGYWVRARISAVSSGSRTPIQANRYVYTTLLPYVEINESVVKGDLPALARIKWTNRSSFGIERVVCGLRSVNRGSNFNAYINISDVQTPFGLTITKGSETGVAWQADKQAPTGRSLIANYSDSGDLETWNDLATITLSTTVARDYYGYFRAMLRCYYNNADANAWNLRLQLRIGSGGTRYTTKTNYPTALSQYEVIDFEQIIISNRQVSSLAGTLSDQLQLVIQGYCDTLSRPITLYDLILIPVDEWALDALVPETSSVGTPEISVNNYLDIDSIANPKVNISVANRNSAGLIVAQYQAINNGPVILQKNATQRYWFLGMTYESFWKANPEIIESIQVFKQQQYLGFRGSN